MRLCVLPFRFYQKWNSWKSILVRTGLCATKIETFCLLFSDEFEMSQNTFPKKFSKDCFLNLSTKCPNVSKLVLIRKDYDKNRELNSLVCNQIKNFKKLREVVLIQACHWADSKLNFQEFLFMMRLSVRKSTKVEIFRIDKKDFTWF